MKRCISLCLCVLLLCALCGCGVQLRYIPQHGVSLNYNNISNANGIWIDNDGIYYFSQDLLFWSIRSIDYTGSHRLTTVNYPSSIQKYGDCLYWVDVADQAGHSDLMKYDLTDGKRSKIVTFNCDSVYDVYPVGDYLYALTRDTDTYELQYGAVQISAQTGEVVTISDDVFACGISGERFVYLVAEKDTMIVYGYDSVNACSVELGRFQPELNIEEYLCDFVNITTDSVVLYSDDSSDSKIHLYNFTEDTYLVTEVSYCISTLNVFEDYAFVLVCDSLYDDQEDQYSLYHLSLSTMEMELLDSDLPFADVFVTSDHDVYIIDWYEHIYYHYASDGAKEEVVVQYY